MPVKFEFQIIRTTQANRVNYTPPAGVLILETDTNDLYAGDGTTAGGNLVSSSGGGNDTYSLRPSVMAFDGTDTGVDGGNLYGCIDTVDFSADDDGAVWCSCELPPAWEGAITGIALDLFYSLNGVDPTKDVKVILEAWVNTLGTSEVPGTPDYTDTYTITSGASNQGVTAMLALTNSAIPVADLATDDVLIFRIKRDANDAGDTYSGVFQLISLRLKKY